MIVYFFGIILFLGCANYVLKVFVDDNEIEFGLVLVNFNYVDDELKLVVLVKEVVILIKDIKAMCRRGSFNLYKFVFNKNVIEFILIEDRVEGFKNIDFDY